jgi:hypothetical protein
MEPLGLLRSSKSDAHEFVLTALKLLCRSVSKFLGHTLKGITRTRRARPFGDAGRLCQPIINGIYPANVREKCRAIQPPSDCRTGSSPKVKR